ncbi:hypothetical protein EDD11_000206 [Mortierella claussenii]|nr:hypothetical protein EDD11_000206 [Mortierella claussenii]
MAVSHTKVAGIPIGTPFTFDNHTQENNDVETAIQSAVDKALADERAGVIATHSDAHTILRIKRKRYEEPLDTLVVQEQLEKLTGKKLRTQEGKEQQERDNDKAGAVCLPKPSPAVFRLATTVDKGSFKDPTQSMQLRDRINHLADSNRRPRSRMSERYPDLENQAQKNRAELTEKRQRDAQSARYRVINQNRTGLAPAEQLPPRVISSKEAQAEAALEMFKMYDAVKEETPKTKEQLLRDAEESDIMCNFLPMVREYLTISDRSSDPKIMSEDSEQHGTSSASRTKKSDPAEADDSEDEYVYDIYYRDVHADHEQETGHRTIGSLLWFSDDENNFLNEDDSSEDDYEDSDSNAEDYYQNDYPEDELSENEYAYKHELSDSDDDDYMY